MNQELEIEFKNLLTEKEYQQLFDYYEFSDVEPIVQKNYYFDTNERALQNIQAALRIRVKTSAAEITLKTPQDGHLLETNETISLKEAEKLINQESFIPPQSVINQLKKENVIVAEVQLIGSLKTKRVEKEYKNALLVLDQSWYNNTVDFELELEASSHDIGNDLFYNVLLEHNIPKRNTPNKIVRALNNGASHD